MRSFTDPRPQPLLLDVNHPCVKFANDPPLLLCREDKCYIQIKDGSLVLLISCKTVVSIRRYPAALFITGLKKQRHILDSLF